MTVLRTTALVKAPMSTVGAALRHTRTAEQGLLALGVRGRATTAAGVLLAPGDEIMFGPVGIPLHVGALKTRVIRADADRFTSVLISGPLPFLRHDTVLTEAGAETLLTDTLEWSSPCGLLGRLIGVPLVRRFVRKLLDRRAAGVRALAQCWTKAEIVVGAAIVHNGLMLAQQRHYPADHAGRWELPGGRVESGEREVDAIVRECAEELDVTVRPCGRVGTDVPLPNGMLLRIHAAELRDHTAVPRAVEHQAVRWINGTDLPTLDWLEADRLLVHSLRALLAD